MRKQRWQRDGVLFDPVSQPQLHPRANYTATSRAAAEAIAPKAAPIRERVLEAIRTAGPRGMTHQQIAACTGIWLDTVKPRVHELGQMGLVVALKQARHGGHRGAALAVFVAKEHAGNQPLADWPRKRTDWRRVAEDLNRQLNELKEQLKSLSERSGS